MDELKSGDLYVEHSGDYDDYRNHLVSWEEYDKEVENYGELVGLPMEPKAFISSLSEQLKTLSREVDKRFPENGSVDIDETGLVIRRAERQKPPPELEMVDEAIRAQMNDVSILDVDRDGKMVGFAPAVRPAVWI